MKWELYFIRQASRDARKLAATGLNEEGPPVTGKTVRVATDVGGTFTDLVAFDSDPRGGAPAIRIAKTDTTPPSYEEGVLRVLDKAGIDAASVSFLAHGTTVVINALIERRGVRVGLITTEGFRDTLEIARGNRPDFFNLHYRKPEPFVPRRLRRELPGRMSYRGEELRPLDVSPLAGILSDFAAEGVEAVAICFLHSYANPAHERDALAEVGRLRPEVPAIASHQITREWREYERTSTTVLSAYVQPLAARGIVRIANNNMVNALELVSVNRGFDPRDFTLIAFGGGGAMHASALARELGVAKVVVPAGASVFSAFGMMMSDLRRDYVVTRLADLVPENAAGIERAFGEAEEHARSGFAAEGLDASRVKLVRFGRFRYRNQEHGTEVRLAEGPVSAERIAGIEAAFHETYEREYTYRLDAPVEMQGFRLVASVEVGKLAPTRREATGEDVRIACKGRREVDYALEGRHRAAIYDGERLLPGMRFEGPAIVEDPGTTVVAHPGDRAEVDGFGNLHLQVRD